MIHTRSIAALVILATSMLAGCDGQPDVVYLEDDDPKMAAAIKKARSTADKFIAALAAPKPGQVGFSVKLAITEGDHTEHMWITPVRYKDGKFYGQINNDPDQVKTVKIGDQVDVAKAKISDWMYLEKGKLIGGYTIRALRDSQSPAERAEFDRSVPFKFD
jgi:uncharacterized protein YegJ (DUF2314 family)